MKSLVVLPTYNEIDNIWSLLDSIFENLPATDVLIIDDNSPDGTGEMVDDLCKINTQLRVVHRSGKLGLGTAYIRGFQYAIENHYDLVFEMDADFSHDPKTLPQLVRACEDSDLVIGSRYVPGGSTPDWSPMRRFVSSGGNLFARFVLGIPIHDCTGGFRCYRVDSLRQINTEFVVAEGYAFQVEMAYLFWKRQMKVKEVPIEFIDRRVGHSKMSNKIVVEAVRWILATRFKGHPAARADSSKQLDSTTKSISRARV